LKSKISPNSVHVKKSEASIIRSNIPRRIKQFEDGGKFLRNKNNGFKLDI